MEFWQRPAFLVIRVHQLGFQLCCYAFSPIFPMPVPGESRTKELLILKYFFVQRKDQMIFIFIVAI